MAPKTGAERGLVMWAPKGGLTARNGMNPLNLAAL